MATLAQKLAKPGNYNRCTLTQALTVTATANTDFIVALPTGALNATYRTYTTTGFGAATDAQISVGKTAGAADLVAATTIKAVGVKGHTPVDAQAADHLNAPTTIYVRVAQSGTASATGAATFCVDYSLPVS